MMVPADIYNYLLSDYTSIIFLYSTEVILTSKTGRSYNLF